MSTDPSDDTALKALGGNAVPIERPSPEMGDTFERFPLKSKMTHDPQDDFQKELDRLNQDEGARERRGGTRGDTIEMMDRKYKDDYRWWEREFENVIANFGDPDTGHPPPIEDLNFYLLDRMRKTGAPREYIDRILARPELQQPTKPPPAHREWMRMLDREYGDTG